MVKKMSRGLSLALLLLCLCSTICLAAGKVGLEGEEILRGIVVVQEDAVSGAEAKGLSQLVHINRAFIGHVIAAPARQNGDEDHQSEEEVVKHTARHHQQALPGRMRTELPGLGILFEEIGIHGLIHHAGNLAVAAKGQPAHTILRLPYLEGKQFEAAYIEEQEELIHANLEDTRPKEVPRLVNQDQHGQGQDYLQNSHTSNRDSAMR